MDGLSDSSNIITFVLKIDTTLWAKGFSKLVSVYVCLHISWKFTKQEKKRKRKRKLLIMDDCTQLWSR